MHSFTFIWLANEFLLCRLLREETAEAAALREKEAAEEAERQRVRASVRGALTRPVSFTTQKKVLPICAIIQSGELAQLGQSRRKLSISVGC